VTCWVVIPVKAPDACKTRLAAVLSDAARRRLVATMLDHVVDVARSVAGVDEVLLVGPSLHDLPLSMRLLADPGRGLNAALASAAETAAREAVDRLLFVSADLPHLVPADLEALIAQTANGGAIAPDRAGTGTNALSLPGRRAPAFRLHYGVGSFAAHTGEARRIGIDLDVIRSATLALDIDVPSDLEALSNDRHAA
jgi:2-phospho-L-lactate guanylyltransferase